MDLEKLLIQNESNAEFAYDSEEFLLLLREFIMNMSDMMNSLTFASIKDEYKDCVRLWIQNLYQYVSEAFNNLIIGNMYSFYILVRTLLENRIYFEYIVKYKEKGIWKKWKMYSCINMLKLFPDAEKTKMTGTIKEIFSETGLEWKNNIRDKSWLEDVFPDKKGLTVSDLCTALGKKDLYKDYQDLSNYVHGQNLFVKIDTSVFYNSIYHKIIIMIDTIMDCMKITIKEFPEYEEVNFEMSEIQYEMYEYLIQEGWASFEE